MDLPGVPSVSQNFPPLQPPGVGGLPVVPPPPPKSRPGGRDFSGSFAMGPPGTLEPLERGYEGQRTPTSQFSGTGQFGQTPPTGPGPMIPGTPPTGPGPMIPGFPPSGAG